MSLEGTTIFHRIIRGEIPAQVVYEDDWVLGFRDINAVAPDHVLIIPKTKSIPRLADIDATDCELLGRMLLAVQKVADQLGLSESGFRVVINSGESAGQTVFQLHMHLLGGRDFSWPPG
jgi:histidine triad (HIT) family protein